MTTKLFTFATASAIACALTISPAWANPEGGYGGHGGGYEKDRHGMGKAMMEMMMHGGAGHLIRHLLKHEKGHRAERRPSDQTQGAAAQPR
jgi:protein CpxP